MVRNVLFSEVERCYEIFVSEMYGSLVLGKRWVEGIRVEFMRKWERREIVLDSCGGVGGMVECM